MPQTMGPTLTDAQVADYHEHGYVLVDDVFPQHELDTIHADLDAALAQRKQQDGGQKAPGSGWLMSLGRQTELTRQVCEDARLLDLISPLVYPGIAIYSAKLVTKEPFDDDVCHWHQDEAYYIKNSASDCRLSIYVALQDITEDMGCLRVIPGSHKDGLQDAETKEGGTCRLGMVNKPDTSKAIPVPMKAGSVLIFSALLQHGSPGNPTDKRRRAFIVSYQEATATGGNGQQWKILRAAE